MNKIGISGKGLTTLKKKAFEDMGEQCQKKSLLPKGDCCNKHFF